VTPDEVFERALAITLEYEGGYSAHPADPGGATYKGVTHWTFAAYLAGKGQPLRDVRSITETELREIYRRGYWDAIGAAEMSPALAIVAFDIACNSGPARVKAWLAEQPHTAVSLSVRRMAHFTSLKTWPTFSRGWARRCVGVLAAALEVEATV
jgi:lysozyme family protein